MKHTKQNISPFIFFHLFCKKYISYSYTAIETPKPKQKTWVEILWLSAVSESSEYSFYSKIREYVMSYLIWSILFEKWHHLLQTVRRLMFITWRLMSNSSFLPCLARQSTKSLLLWLNTCSICSKFWGWNNGFVWRRVFLHTLSKIEQNIK